MKVSSSRTKEREEVVESRGPVREVEEVGEGGRR